MTSRTEKLFSTEQVRAIDARLISEGFASGFDLMERAGQQAFEVIESMIKGHAYVVILCGTGNNGGDGWIIGREAIRAGFSPQVFLIGDEAKITGDSRRALDSFRSEGGRIGDATELRQFIFSEDTLVIDAVIGSGFAGDLRAEHIDLATRLNESRSHVVAIDCPTGLDADTGMPKPVAVKAVLTLTFIAYRQGFFTGESADYTGAIQLCDLGVPESVLADVPNGAKKISPGAGMRHSLKRKNNFHKGLGGHVLVVGGNSGLGGAAILAAEAALRIGAGKVTLASRASTVCAANARCPALMAITIDDPQQLNALCEEATVILVGPGLGQCDWARNCLKQVLASRSSLVIDADALNLIAQGNGNLLGREGWPVITPHPGEAARLLGITTAEIGRDRFAAVRSLAKFANGTALLKGAGTLVASDQAKGVVGVCTSGNPYMATAGSGDVLSGLIAGLAAQGLSPVLATELAVYLHASAADEWVAAHGRCLIATDIIDALPRAMNTWIDS